MPSSVFPLFEEVYHRRYLSISDVRYFMGEWYDHILIRTAKDETDYRGGFNHYTTLEKLDAKAAELLGDMPF